MNILILGHMNCGKTTVAKYIQEKYKYNIYSFGNGIKIFTSHLFEILNELDPSIKKIDINDLHDRTKKENYRRYMQMISTDLCRNEFGNDIWVKYLKKRIDYSKPFVIDDLRFKSEFEAFKNNNTVTIRIINPNEIKSDHISEHELDNLIANYTIFNDGSVEDLYEIVDKIMISINSLNEF